MENSPPPQVWNFPHFFFTGSLSVCGHATSTLPSTYQHGSAARHQASDNDHCVVWVGGVLGRKFFLDVLHFLEIIIDK